VRIEDEGVAGEDPREAVLVLVVVHTTRPALRLVIQAGRQARVSGRPLEGGDTSQDEELFHRLYDNLLLVTFWR
jgi:hypothetical protein